MELISSASIKPSTKPEDLPADLLNDLEQVETQFKTQYEDLKSLNKDQVQLSEKMAEVKSDLMQQLESIQQMSQLIADMKSEINRLVDEEKVFERQTVAELEPIVENQNHQCMELEQEKLRLEGLRDSMNGEMQALSEEVDCLVQSLDELKQSTKKGKETAEQRIFKQKIIREWYDSASKILSSLLGSDIEIDEKNSCLTAWLKRGNNMSHKPQVKAIMRLGPQQLQIHKFEWDCEYPFEDIVKISSAELEASGPRDLCSIIRQLSVRVKSFDQKNAAHSASVYGKYNIDYSVIPKLRNDDMC